MSKVIVSAERLVAVAGVPIPEHTGVMPAGPPLVSPNLSSDINQYFHWSLVSVHWHAGSSVIPVSLISDI